jgi:hypothetical protein
MVRNAQNRSDITVPARGEPGAILVCLRDGTTIEVAAGAMAVIGADGTVCVETGGAGRSARGCPYWLVVIGRDVRAALVATVVIEVLRGFGVSS